jgi:hypothetical protein
MCRPGDGAANPLFFLWSAFGRPTAPASRTKRRRTAEESRTSGVYTLYGNKNRHMVTVSVRDLLV